MRVSSNMAFEMGVNALLDQQADMLKIQEQLATGKRVVSPADDPVAATLSLDIEEVISKNNQYSQNANYANTRISFTETTLQSVQDTLQRIRELSVQGLNDTLDANSRSSIAKELEQRFDALVGLANSSDGNGEYVFAGYASDTPPFSGNLSTGISYVGDQGQRRLQISENRTVAVTDNGVDVFGKIKLPNKTLDVSDPTSANYDPTDGNYNGRYDPTSADYDPRFNPDTPEYIDLFSAMKNLIEDMDSDNPEGNSLDEIDAAINHFSEIMASVGGRRNAIDDQLSINESYNIDLEASLSELVDLDYAEAISEFQLKMAGYQAAQQTFTRINSVTLFDYL